MPPIKSQITYDDFARLVIRIGKVVDASELLILGADNSEGQVIVLSPHSEVAAGESVY